MAQSDCRHVAEVGRVHPRTAGCAECLKGGDRWVNLRVCLSCGEVSCCDSSPNRHARAHFESEGHPVMQSFEPGELWRYCFAHEQPLSEGAPLSRAQEVLAFE